MVGLDKIRKAWYNMSMTIEEFFNKLPIKPKGEQKDLFNETLNDFFAVKYNRKSLDEYMKTLSPTKNTIIKMFCSLDDRLDVCSFVPKVKKYILASLLEIANQANKRDSLLLKVIAYTNLPIKRIVQLTTKDIISLHTTYIDGYLVPNLELFNTEYLIPSLDTHGNIIEKEQRNVKSFWNLCNKIIPRYDYFPQQDSYIELQIENGFFAWEKN